MKKTAAVRVLAVLAAVLGLVCLWACGESVPAQSGGELQVRILQTVDDADCIILSQGADAVMIDTGEEQDGEHMLQELREAEIERIDALILTHPDKDHIGGALLLLQEFPVEKVFHPYYDGEEERWEKVKDYCREQEIRIEYPGQVQEIDTGYVNLVVYPPRERHYKKDNNYSLAILAEHGDVKMFFGGDALRKRSEELLAMNLPEVALYKVAHHGRANSASEKLFEALHPAYAVVTSDKADEEILESGSRCGCRILFSRKADILFTSDGERLTLLESGEAERGGKQNSCYAKPPGSATAGLTFDG